MELKQDFKEWPKVTWFTTGAVAGCCGSDGGFHDGSSPCVFQEGLLPRPIARNSRAGSTVTDTC